MSTARKPSTTGGGGGDHPSCFSSMHNLILTTAPTIPTYRIKHVYGTVYGLTVRSRNWGADIGAALKSSMGGELRPFTKMLYAARDEATERMMGECMARGGNAIVAMRYDAGEMKVFSQVCAYGTAVYVEKIEEGKSEGEDVGASEAM